MPIKLSPARYAGRLAPTFNVVVDPGAVAPPPLESTNAYAYDITLDRPLYAKDHDEHGGTTPASLVKLMTGLLLYERKGPGGENVLATETAAVTSAHISAGGSSIIGLMDTDTATWDEWLYMLLQASDNAVGEMIADLIGDEIDGGGRTTFLSQMALKAAALGMSETTFASPSGFPSEDDRMSPRDVMKLLRQVATVQSGGMRAYLSQHAYTFTIDSGPSAPSIGPWNNPVDLLTSHTAEGLSVGATDIKDFGVLIGKGGLHTGPSPDTYSVAALWQAPNGNEIAIINLHATRDGHRYLDWRAMMYELPDDFPYLLDGFSVGTDADFASVTLLAGFNGSIADESSVGRVLTAQGDAAVNATNPIEGSGDLVLDGTGDLVDTPDTPDMDIGSGDCTVECFIRGDGAEPGSFRSFVAKWNTTGNQRQWALNYDHASNRIIFYTSTTGADFPEAYFDLDTFDITPSVFFNGAKRHIMGTKNSSTTAAYVNGVRGDGPATAASLFANTALTTVGGRYAGATPELLFAGNIDEVRVTVGTDRTAGAEKLPINGRAFPRS